MADSFKQTKNDIISDGGLDSSGKASFTRRFAFSYSGDSTIVDLMESELYPNIGDADATYTAFSVDSIGSITLNDGSKEMWFDVKYSRDYSINGSYKSGGKKPWNLPPQNVNISYVTMQEPMTEMYKKDGDSYEKCKLLNTAGCKITATKSVYIPVLSFDYNIKTIKQLNAYPVINSETTVICGYSYEPLTGLLMPMTASKHKYKDNSTSSYYTIHVEIRYNKNTWNSTFLNVGNMAKFPNGESGETLTLQPIYQYSPWTSKDDSANILITPKFGSIADVIKANNAYQKAINDKTKKIPWNEITDPMPLDDDGKLDTSALSSGEYNKLSFFESKPISWASFNLPKANDSSVTWG